MVRSQPAASLTVLRSSPAPRFRIVCFPHAGASVSAFRAWPAVIGQDTEIAVVHLPGRYDRMGQEPFGSLTAAARGAAGLIPATGQLPTALFGHSLGALLAFEVARSLPADAVRLLVVSGAPAPHLARAADPMASLSDEDFLERVHELGATPDDVFANPELVAVVLPTLRADFAMAEDYCYQPSPPLGCPILALGGDRDPFVGEQDLLGWKAHTASSASAEILPGGHLFIRDQFPAALAHVRQAMYDACGVEPGPPPLGRRNDLTESQPSVVMTRGLPAAGKTTWARGEVERLNDMPIRISLDDLRDMFFERRVSPQSEAFLAAARDTLITLALEHGRDVIVDATNLDPAQEESVQALVGRYPRARLDIADFTPVPLETCIRRDHSRERPIGEAAIRDMFLKYIRSAQAGLVPRRRHEAPADDGHGGAASAAPGGDLR